MDVHAIKFNLFRQTSSYCGKNAAQAVDSFSLWDIYAIMSACCCLIPRYIWYELEIRTQPNLRFDRLRKLCINNNNKKNHVVSQWPQVTFCVSLSLEQHLSHHNCLRMFKVFPQRRGKNWYSGTALLSYIHNSIDIQMNEKHFPAFSSISAIHQVALPFFMLSSWHPLECGLCFIFHLRFSWKRVCLSTFSYGVA